LAHVEVCEFPLARNALRCAIVALCMGQLSSNGFILVRVLDERLASGSLFFDIVYKEEVLVELDVGVA